MFLHRYSLYLAWVLALIGTLGSLYFGEIMNLPICTLCWFQRIFLFPLVWILGVAAFVHDHRVRIYAAPLAFIGILFTLPQILQSFFPMMFATPLCGVNTICGESPLIFGFISLSWMSFILFVLIFIFLLLAGRQEPRKKSRRR